MIDSTTLIAPLYSAATGGRAYFPANLLRVEAVVPAHERTAGSRYPTLPRSRQVVVAEPSEKPMRVNRVGQEPDDALLTFSGGRSLGLIRPWATLSTSNLCPRLRNIKRLRYDGQLVVTMM